MTLNTVGYIKGVIDWKDFHYWVNANLLKAPNADFTYKEAGLTYDEWNGLQVAERSSLDNRGGQGFAAWFMLSWSNTPCQDDDWEQDVVREYYDSDEEFEDAWSRSLARQHALGDFYGEFSFDTAYGYKDENGLDCSGLHASYLVRIYREYLEPRGVDMVWMNEYTSERFTNLDGLTTLLGSGEKAGDWFEHTVKPYLNNTLGIDLSK